MRICILLIDTKMNDHDDCKFVSELQGDSEIFH